MKYHMKIGLWSNYCYVHVICKKMPNIALSWNLFHRFKSLVRVLQRAHGKSVAVYAENYTDHIVAVCRQSSVLINITAGDTHRALMAYNIRREYVYRIFVCVWLVFVKKW